MSETTVQELAARLQRLEDEQSITKLILQYGPSADAGLADRAGALWLEDGVYDWDDGAEPHRGSAGVAAMLHGRRHQSLIGAGVAHFSGPPLIHLDGDTATALSYSLIMRREDDRFYLWRVSAARWDLERSAATWRIRCRSNRLMDATGAGRESFRRTLQDVFGDIPD